MLVKASCSPASSLLFEGSLLVWVDAVAVGHSGGDKVGATDGAMKVELGLDAPEWVTESQLVRNVIM